MGYPEVHQKLLLASQSPRRRALLRQIGIECQVVVVDVDETPLPGEGPRGYVCRLALEKAKTALHGIEQDVPVLAADTAVVLDDEMLGKPRHKEEALKMLAGLSGREHQVVTGVALVKRGWEECRVSESTVRFRATSHREREAYWRTGECADKAGSYGIQGRGAMFVEHLSGSYSGVVGLPLFETTELLQMLGMDPLQSGDRD